MKRLQRFALVATLICFAAAGFAQGSAASGQPSSGAGSASERTSGSLDVILLLDKSLSMAPFFGEVKSYVAGQVLGPILEPGDRLVVELVYGKVQRLYSGTIASEAEKAAAIRAIRAVKADGPFTDLGKALDAAKRDADELGMPERPKYVLLVTDERQEAPAGSPYRSPDYRLRHPALEFIRRVDLGRFRAIAVGLQVGAKVAEAAPNMLRFLSEPPPSRAAGSAAGAAGGASPGAAGPQGAQASPSSVGGKSSGSAEPGASGSGDSSTGAKPAISRPLAIGGAIVVVAALAAIVLVLLQSSRKKKEEERRGES